MKKIFSVFCSLILLFNIFMFKSFAEGQPDISARSAVVICAETGEVVYSKNMNECLPMASTTKIMTAILALEYGADDHYLTVTEDIIAVEGSSMGLKDGDSVSLKTLVKGMLLKSGNDAANAVANIVAGDIPSFIKMMNEKATSIGMYSTSFETPSGLDGDNHYSTAFDMAILGAYAIQNPEFRSICSAESMTVYYGSSPYRRTLTNHNKLLTMYDGAFGIKTGFTKKSGRCLVSAVKRDGKTLVAVTLNAPDDWDDHIKMYDYAFNKVSSVNLTADTDNLVLNIVGGTKDKVSVVAENIPAITVLNDNYHYETEIFIKHFEYAPIDMGEIVGKIQFYSNGVKISETNLITTEEVLCVEN